MQGVELAVVQVHRGALVGLLARVYHLKITAIVAQEQHAPVRGAVKGRELCIVARQQQFKLPALGVHAPNNPIVCGRVQLPCCPPAQGGTLSAMCCSSPHTVTVPLWCFPSRPVCEQVEEKHGQGLSGSTHSGPPAWDRWLVRRCNSPEAADVAGVRPEKVYAILCARVLHIISLSCSLHAQGEIRPLVFHLRQRSEADRRAASSSVLLSSMVANA